MSDLILSRFRKFKDAAVAASKASGNSTLSIFGKTVAVAPTATDGLQSLAMISIDGRERSLAGTDADIANLAAEGYLGADMVVLGNRRLEILKARQRKKDFQEFKSKVTALWGDYATKLLREHERGLLNPRVAEVTMQVRQLPQPPKSIGAARKQFPAMPGLRKEEWRLVQHFLEVLGK